MSSVENLSWDELHNLWESEGFIKTPEEKKKYDGPHTQASIEEVKSALEYISPDVGNDEWTSIGMAIQEEFGDQGFEVWDKWSSQGSKYNKYEMKMRWRSFGRREGVTIGTLFFLAQEAGWRPILAEPETTPEFILNGKLTGWAPTPSKKTVIHKESVRIVSETKKVDQMQFPKELLKAPGLPGTLSDFIDRTSLMPQPILGLGAAIAAAGALMGRKVRGDTNIRTNMYVIGLAPSGSGKDHARTIIKRLFNDTGLGKLELGAPASSAGLITSLRTNGEGRGLILWDEFGRMLKQIMGWKAGSHERDILTAIIELFSSSQSIYMGKQYANHDGKNPMKPIDQPCLSIYGTSVPSHFYDALSGSEAIDGFLSRWLIFESKTYSTEEEEREESFAETPQAIIDVCKYWKEQPFNNEPGGGNLSDAMKVVPRLIKSSKAANDHLKAFAARTRKTAIDAENSGDPKGAIWSRAGEHARRLALVAHEGDQIELNVAEWAVKLADYCCQYMSAAIGDYVSSSELEAQTKRVLRTIREKGDWVYRADITRSFQGIPSRIRNEIVASLVERNELLEEKVSGIGAKMKLRYRAIAALPE